MFKAYLKVKVLIEKIVDMCPLIYIRMRSIVDKVDMNSGHLSTIGLGRGYSVSGNSGQDSGHDFRHFCQNSGHWTYYIVCPRCPLSKNAVLKLAFLFGGFISKNLLKKGY